MNLECGLDCDFCNKKDFSDKFEFSVWKCVQITSLMDIPFLYSSVSMESIPVTLTCSLCPRITNIPNFSNMGTINCAECENLISIDLQPGLKKLYMKGSRSINTLPEFPKLKSAVIDCCTLLYDWKGVHDKLKDVSCQNCHLLHFNLNLFLRFKGFDRITSLTYYITIPFVRSRNGVSSRLIFSFRLAKSLYSSELPSRVAFEVRRDSVLYAPGGVKYLELAARYK